MNIIMCHYLYGFRPVAGNWQIAGDVYFNPDKYEDAKTIKGVLVNMPTDKNKDNLFTTWGNTAIQKLEMEKGANASVQLQGRYEIQLFDSWGVKNPKASDWSGIYERWDENRPKGKGQKGYKGYPQN